MFKRIICILAFCSSFSAVAQLQIRTFEEVETLWNESPKPIVVFIETKWCKYCKIMRKTSLQHEKVVRLLNENYYFVSLDAESQKAITFSGRTFDFIPNGPSTGIHELAWELGQIDGSLGYPTLTVLNLEKEIIFQRSATLRPRSLERILTKLLE